MPNISTEQLYDLINNLMREFRDSDALKRLHFELITRLDSGYLGDFYRTEYFVKGHGPFPIDMLRYTHSFPADEEAGVRITASCIDVGAWDERTIKLCKYHRDATPQLANDRWVSKFRWQVIGDAETTPL